MPSFAQSYVTQYTGINGPTFVALDTRAGTTWLYVSEHGGVDGTGTGGGRILKYNLTTGSTAPTVIATAGNADGQFRSPDQILVEPTTGDLFIADRYLNRIQRITNTGTFVMKWGSSTSGAADEMHGPVGLARDSAGAIYVTEHGDANGGGVAGNVVAKYTISGNTATKVWRKGNSFNVPYGITVAGSNLIISDGFNARLQIWDLNGNPTSMVDIPGVIPLGLTTDSTGAVWLAESSDNGNGTIQRVEKRTAAGAAAGVSFGTQGSGPLQFLLPFDTAIDTTANRAYVADYSNNRVQVINLSSAPADTTAPTIASITAGTGTANSVPFTVTFSEPVTGVAASAFTASGAGASVSSVNAVSTTAYTVNVAFTGTTGTVTLAVNSTANSSIKDAANNFYAGGGTTSGTYTIPTSGGGGGGGGGSDTTAPTVLASSWAVTPTDANQNAYFTVNFSEPVTGVDASDFVMRATGNTSARVTTVTGSGATYQVAFFYDGTQGFSGSVQMAIKTSGTGITDAAGNAFAGGGVLASPPVSVGGITLADSTNPTVSSFTAGTASGSVVPFTLVFSEAVTGVDAADFVSTRTGTATAQVGAITGSGTTYTVPVTFSGTGTIQLTVLGGGTSDIRDAASNWFGATASSNVYTLPTSSGSAPTIAAQSTSGTVGTAMNYQVVATGATSFTVVGTPTLPANLNLSSTGLITGTPSAAGTTNVTIRATNSVGSTDAVLTITIAAAPPAGTAPTISAQSTTGTVGTALNYQVVATGATSFTVTGLPANGLSMSSTGLITGTPTASGPITANVTAINATGSATAAVTITINPAAPVTAAPVITSPLTLSVSAGAPFSYTITASNSPTSFTATNRPAGVNFTSPTISGSVATTGVYNITISAANATGTDTKTLVLTVTTAPVVPVVTSATITGTTGTAVNYQVLATNSPTSWTYVGTLPSGLSFNATNGVISGTPTAANSSSINVLATNGGGTGSGTITFNITGSTINPGGTGGNTGGTGGSTGGTGGSTGGGGGGGGGSFLISQTISITPITTAVVNEPVSLNATSTSGGAIAWTLVSGNATLNGNILTPKGAGSILVRASQAGGGIYLPASADATIVVKGAAQTITFVSPVSGIVVNQPVTLSASSTSGLPIMYTVVSGSATIEGSVLTPRSREALIIRATQAGNADYAPASTDVNFGIPQKASQSINLSALTDVSVTSGPISLPTISSAGLPITYTLVSGPATLSGTTLTLNKAAGVITLRASQGGNDTYNPAADVTRTITVRAIGQQVYMGMIGTDPVAVVISADNTKGLFLTRIAATGEAIVAKFTLNANGTFTANATSSLPASTDNASPTSETPATAAATQPRTITGTVNNGVVTGNIVELNRTFTANLVSPTGTAAAMAGVYIANIPGSASGDTYIVVSPTGQAYAVAVTPFGVSSGTGTIASDGTVTVNTGSGGSIAAKIDANTGAITGTLNTGTTTAAFVGLSDGTTRSDRLVNLSSRLRVVAGDASRSVIAGFVVSGTESKKVLVRAVGPGLSGFGVSDALSNPKLQLYRGTTLVAENDDWNNSNDVSTTGDSVGAFKLGASSRDSAIVSTLAPGAYTAVVTGVGGNGVALIEVYDASTNQPIGAQQLINISTRGYVEAGEGNLIAGFVVTGNAPKRVLIRGIGPGLSTFGVPDALMDPVLKVYSSSSANPIAQNDNWGTAQAINATQVAATAAEISAASSATGAFALNPGSRDAAVVITLMPGQYSAVVSGAGNTTGAGLVEVYEIPNP